jgi:hypothetical protein
MRWSWTARYAAGCDDGAVILTVWVPFWELEEDDRVLSVGDELSSWLEFHEADRFAPAERVGAVHGVAHVLPRWPGAEAGRHPTQRRRT